MTPEEIDKMPAGRKLDALIAEKVMGCKLFKEHIAWRCDCPGPNSAKLRPHGHWATGYIYPYSADIAAAWQVVEKLTCTTKQWFHFDQSSTTYTAIFQNDDYEGYDAEAEADTAPLAICRAALKAHLAAQEPQLEPMSCMVGGHPPDCTGHNKPMNKRSNLARTCNLDGTQPKVFRLPPPRITSKLVVNPDGTGTCELTAYGKWLLGLLPDGPIQAEVSKRKN